MSRFTNGLIGGLAIGLIIGASAAISTDGPHRRRVMRDGKRALRKAGNFVDDMFH